MDQSIVPPTPAPKRIVGVVGGGQLAQMLHLAAVPLGIEVLVLCPGPDEPAVRAGASHLCGDPTDLDDLLALAERSDVVTLDHERAPAEHLATLVERGHRVAPGPTAARAGQNKVAARSIAWAHGVAVAPWMVTAEPGEVAAFAEQHGWPLHLKRPTGGYDGRGVWEATSLAGAEQILADAATPLIVEPTLPFTQEISVMVARSWSGALAIYPLIETVQHDGVCREAFTPAPLDPELDTAARRVAATMASAVGLVGLMAVELFVVDGRLLLNELAVRPHNSAHLSIEACTTSQFENHLRGVLDLPLGAVRLRVPAAAMVNVTGDPGGGDPFERIDAALEVAGAAVHRYGKRAEPGRKLGHVTAVGADIAEARAIANRSASAMTLDPSR